MQQPFNPKSSRKGIANDHPKHVALAADIPQRLQSWCSFRREANNLSTLLPAELEHRQFINLFTSPPWKLGTPREGQNCTTVPGVAGRVDDIDLKC